MTRAAFALLLGLHGLVTATQVSAQSLQPPSRTVFKCNQGGKTVYSDAPCLGAQRIEVEPTRGVSKLSGKERIGNDVQQECRRLDIHIPPLERQELQTTSTELADVQHRLFALRKRFRELGC